MSRYDASFWQEVKYHWHPFAMYVDDDNNIVWESVNVDGNARLLILFTLTRSNQFECARD